MKTLLTLALLASAMAPAAAVAQNRDAAAKQFLSSPKFAAAKAKLAADHDRVVADVITLTEIEAPPFKEAKRAAAFLE
ncbi:hypothetical protein, partial [Escherichia coli]